MLPHLASASSQRSSLVNPKDTPPGLRVPVHLPGGCSSHTASMILKRQSWRRFWVKFASHAAVHTSGMGAAVRLRRASRAVRMPAPAPEVKMPQDWHSNTAAGFCNTSLLQAFQVSFWSFFGGWTCAAGYGGNATTTCLIDAEHPACEISSAVVVLP